MIDSGFSSRRECDAAYINNFFILAPLGFAAVHVFLLFPSLRSDPPLLAEELRVVFQGEAEVRNLRRLRELTEPYLPGVEFPASDAGPDGQDRR